MALAFDEIALISTCVYMSMPVCVCVRVFVYGVCGMCGVRLFSFHRRLNPFSTANWPQTGNWLLAFIVSFVFFCFLFFSSSFVHLQVGSFCGVTEMSRERGNEVGGSAYFYELFCFTVCAQCENR